MKEIIKSTIAVMLGIMLILSFNMLTVFAVTQSDVDEIQNQINGSQKKLDEVGEELKGTLKQIKQLDFEISSYEDDIEGLDTQIESVTEKITKAEEELKLAEEKYIEQKENFGERLVAIYEAGETSYLDVLLSSNDIVDFITKYYLVEDMAECDNNMLEMLEKNRIDIENNKQILETSKKQIEDLKKSKEKTMVALQNSQVTKQNYADQLTEDEKELEEEIKELTAKQKQMQAELEAASKKYSNEIANLGGNGTLQMPVRGGTVTCNMYYSSGKYHGAMDIGIVVGTKVYAAEEGIVLQAGWNNTGYGYLTVIQHANGLRTYYGHGNGTMYVKPGEKVERGQLIMLSR